MLEILTPGVQDGGDADAGRCEHLLPADEEGRPEVGHQTPRCGEGLRRVLRAQVDELPVVAADRRVLGDLVTRGVTRRITVPPLTRAAVAELTTGGEDQDRHIGFGPQTPADPMTMLWLIQNRRDLKLAGQDRIILSRHMPTLSLRIQAFRELCSSLEKPPAALAKAANNKK